MEEKRLMQLVVAAALSGACFAAEPSAPAKSPLPLAQLRALREAKTLLCWPMFQYPYLQFAVRHGAETGEVLEKWNASFDALAERALADAAFAGEMFAEGNAVAAGMRDGGEGDEFVKRFRALGARVAEQTCKSICDGKPEMIVPFAKALIGSQTPVVFDGKSLRPLPAGPVSTLAPDAVGSLMRRLHEAVSGKGGNAAAAKALDAEIISFLATKMPADVRDALIDTLLAASLDRAQADAKAVKALVADAGRLRDRLPTADAKDAIDRRVCAFGERMAEQTLRALCGESPESAVSYLRKVFAERTLSARFGKSSELVAFSKSEFPPLSGKFVCRLVADAYQRVAGGKATASAMRPLNALVVKILVGESPDNVPGDLMNVFLGGSVKRAQTDAESARMLFADADALIAGIADTNRQAAVERRCRAFVRKSAIYTFQTICPARPGAVVPYLRKLSERRALCALYGNVFVEFKPGRTSAVPIDLVGQLVEESVIRLSGSGAADSANAKMLNDILDFSAELLPKLSKDAQQSMLDRRLDAFFLTGNYDGAIDLLEKGLPSHSPAWCKGTAAKLRYHRALKAGKKDEALRQLLAFIAFMQSDEQKDFEDCDPTTGVVYSREWIVAKNYMRCAEIAQDLKDGVNGAKYRAAAKDLYAVALEKAKNDPKALAELRKEVKAAGL